MTLLFIIRLLLENAVVEKFGLLESAVRAARELLTKQPFSAEKFDAQWRDVCRYLRDAVRKVGEKILKEEGDEVGDEGHFVHYTSIDAFANMLLSLVNGGGKRACLRLYDSIHFNDPNEGRFLSHELRDQLLWKYGWPPSGESLEKSRQFHSYIASFVGKKSFDEKFPGKKAEDHLLLWRAYGMDGKGCSLSISSDKLSKEIRKVRYGDGACKKICEKLNPILCELKPLFDDELGKTGKIAMKRSGKDIIGIVIDSLEPLRYSYKSDAFSYESECRRIYVDEGKSEQEICFDCERRNNAPARLRHYVEHDDLGIKKLLDSVSVITLGPCVEYKGNIRYCIESLLKRAGISGPIITDSEIEYRSA